MTEHVGKGGEVAFLFSAQFAVNSWLFSAFDEGVSYIQALAIDRWVYSTAKSSEWKLAEFRNPTSS
jgi:RPA family protein